MKAYLADSSSDEEAEVEENEKNKKNKKKLVKASDQDEMSDNEDEDDDEADIAKYRALLNIGAGNELEENKNSDDLTDHDDDTGMEMTFAPNVDQKIDEQAIENMTPWEKYLHKKKNKRKEKKMRQQNNQASSSSKEFTNTENQNSDSDDEEIPSDVDLNDPFFKQESTRQFDGKKQQKNTNLSSKKSSQAANARYDSILISRIFSSNLILFAIIF